MADETIISSEEVEQSTTVIEEEKVTPLYTDEELAQLAKDQEKNTLIKENKDSFIGICNSILDYLYDLRDRNDNNNGQTIEPNDLSDILSLANGIELILKKIKIDAPLADLEFARLALCCQFVGEDMRQRAINYGSAAKEILSFVEKLSK